MAKYKTLNTGNECYDATLITKMNLLYEGGYKIMRHASLFLTKLSIESQKSYDERLPAAAYLPYMAQFVNHFGSSLFSDDLRVHDSASKESDSMDDSDYYREFATNCDMRNNSLHNFIHQTFEESLYCPFALVGVDFDNSPDSDAPQNLAEEEARGLSRPRLYCIDPLSLIDWKKDESNNKFQWVKLKNERVIQNDPLLPALKQMEFKIWVMDGQFAKWQLYQSKAIPLDRSFRDSDDIPMVEEGITSFKEIPVFELKIDDGLHVGSKLGPICEELFQRRSFLVSNMNKTCIAIPVIKLGPEIAGPGETMPSGVQQNPNRAGAVRMQLSNQGYTVLGSEDVLDIVESSGASHKLVDDQLNQLIEKMHELIQQMANSVSSHTKALGRSAASKTEDRHATEIMLSAYANMVKDFVRELYLCIAQARSEDIEWAISGLSTFVEEDRSVLMAEAQMVAGTSPLLSMLPSPTLHKKYLLKLGLSLLGSCSEEDEQSIQDELEAGVDSGDHMEQMTPPDPAPPVQAQSAPVPPPMGPAGQALAPTDAHLQTGQHVNGQVVFDQLAEDYKKSDIQFVLHIPWIGPVEVPLTSIDFSNVDNWQAASEPEQVDQFADKMADDDFSKPVILVNNPSNNNKMAVIDGHHRVLAARQNGTPINAFIGQIGTDRGPWDKLHSKQVGSKQSSQQKQVSNQVAKSETAQGGKTK